MKKKCLHLGNGTVYLESTNNKQWINIDITGVLAKDYPDLVNRNKTTIEKYYKFPFRQNKGNNVTDIIMDVRKLDFKDNSIDEILCVNLIDHLKKEEFLKALKEWKRVLKVGGNLIIDIDDRQKQAEILTSAETNEEIEWALRLIYCDSVSEGRTHFWGFTPDYLKDLLERNGFEFVWVKTSYIVHDMYPNFQISVCKI